MRASSGASPAGDFTVSINPDGVTCTISFYRNAVEVTIPPEVEGGESRTEWQYDRYDIEGYPYRDMLETDIENNEEAWFIAAKMEDERRQGVDIYQMKADLDFISVMQMAMSPIATMSLDAASGPSVLSMAREYFPIRWGKDKLQTLVGVQKLTADDYEDITGEAYTA